MSADWSAIASAAGGILGSTIAGIATKRQQDRNINFQKETNAWNEGLMRESWAREDNAVQRRVEDLQSAGLSPTLAAGSSASAGAPIQLKSPNQEKNPLLEGLTAGQLVMAMRQQREDISMTRAQKRAIETGIAHQQIEIAQANENLRHSVVDNAFQEGQYAKRNEQLDMLVGQLDAVIQKMQSEIRVATSTERAQIFKEIQEAQTLRDQAIYNIEHGMAPSNQGQGSGIVGQINLLGQNIYNRTKQGIAEKYSRAKEIIDRWNRR